MNIHPAKLNFSNKIRRLVLCLANDLNLTKTTKTEKYSLLPDNDNGGAINGCKRKKH